MKILILSLLLVSNLIAEDFLKKGDGTVLDVKNEIFWQECSAGTENCSYSPKPMDWESAMQYCANLKLASKKWKLPSEAQLKLLKKNNGKIIDSSFFKDLIAEESYWSSTENKDLRFATYWVPVNSYIWHHFKTNKSYVRCVSR